MSILKPSSISPNNIALDNSQPITISWKNYGDRQVKYLVEILKNSDNTLVYTSGEIASYNTFHVIPAGSIANGNQLKYTIKVWNSLNEYAISEVVLFKTSSTPTVSITNIIEAGIILNSSYLFQGQYNQAESVAIKSFQFILYDSSNAIISSSPEIFSSTIEYEFSGLLNDRTYKVELFVKSQDNLLSSTGKVQFTVTYDVPTSAITLQADRHKETGGVKLQWNVTQIVGDGENYTFGTNQVDVTNGRVYFDEGFNIDGNFTEELWLEDLTDQTFNIQHDIPCIISASEPSNDNVLWIEESTQSEEKELSVAISSVAPSNVENILWLDFEDQIAPAYLSIEQDMVSPIGLNKLWIDLESTSENTELMELNNGVDKIVLKYYNSTFYLFINGIETQSVEITATKYYLYIQQIGDNYVLHAEEDIE